MYVNTWKSKRKGLGCPKRLSSPFAMVIWMQLYVNFARLCSVSNFNYSWKNQQWPVTLQVVTTKSVTRSFPSLVQGKVAMIPTCWIPPEAFPLLQEIVLRRCEIELGGFHLQQCDEYALNGASMDQRRNWHLNRMTLTGRVVGTLINLAGHCIKAARSALGMDAECRGLNIAGWTKPGEKPFCENLLWISKMSHPPCVFCTVQGRQKLSERSMNKNIQKQIGFALTCRNFTFDFEPQVRHIVEVVPPNFHISVVWGRVFLKMLPLTALDSPTIFFDWSKFCIGLSQFVKALLDCLA